MMGIKEFNPEQKFVIDEQGNRMEYKTLIWAGDLKQLYNRVPLEKINNKNLENKIQKKREYLKDLKGGDSVFTVYMTVEIEPEYFSKICTGHFFYTPSKKGLSAVNTKGLEEFMLAKKIDSDNIELKQKLIDYLNEFCDYNTLEIAAPALRDPQMAPKGKTGLIVSLLFDYQLTRKIEDFGWSDEMKKVLEERFIKVLDESIFPGLKEKVSHTFSSSPLTIEKRTQSTEGGITGWAFTNPYMPVVDKMLTIAKSVNTVLPDVYQCGQWSYSPSGMPISILTGKLASDKAIKKNRS